MIERAALHEQRWKISIQRLRPKRLLPRQVKAMSPPPTNAIRRKTEGTVDLTLKLHEKARTRYWLVGQVSGLAGSFIRVELPHLSGLGRNAFGSGRT